MFAHVYDPRITVRSNVLSCLQRGMSHDADDVLRWTARMAFASPILEELLAATHSAIPAHYEITILKCILDPGLSIILKLKN